MLINDILYEGRDAPLYHATSYENANIIIDEDEIKAYTAHEKCRIGFTKNHISGIIKGVSLTRNFKFIIFSFRTVVFEIDQRRLSHTSKIIPFSYYDSLKARDKTQSSRGNCGFDNEFEEFCIGPIRPLTRYLTRIIVKEKFIDKLKDDPKAVNIINHPLLRVIP